MAHDVTGQRLRPPLCLISGAALASFSAVAKRRLLTNALSEGRRRPLQLRADPEALLLYLTLTLPRSRAIAIESSPGWTVGLSTRDGRSLAYVESRARVARRRISTLTAHGDRRAADELAAAIRAWDDRGRPGPRDLGISVDYHRGEPRLRRRWRVP